MEQFSVRTKIMVGGGLKTLLAQRKRVFLVADPYLAEHGKTAYVTDCVAGECHIFSHVQPDPDLAVVVRGVAALEAFRPDAVVALGGGSAIDAAKAMVYFAARERDLGDCPFIAVPTTSGTGSEVSRFAVITDGEKGIKYPLVDERLLPDYAVLDATLTLTVPPAVTADTGMDVLTHAVEAFTSTAANDFSDGAAEKAIRLAGRWLLTAYRSPGDCAARQGMHNASCLAGIAFSGAGLGLCHSMAHALGGRFHLPHGRANAILLPYVIGFNGGYPAQTTPTALRYAALAALLDRQSSSPRQSTLNLIRAIRQLAGQLGIPPSLGAAGVG
ncbi:MAG: 1-propanol dehydrogenase PduQ, partial [Pseudoflavonifractor sp.]